MKSILHFTLLVALLVGATVLCVHAADSTLGSPELNLLQDLLTGKFGMFVGLFVAFVGAYTAVVKGNSGFGIGLIVLGILITMLPGVYNGVRLVTCPLVEALGGSCTGSTNAAPQQSQ